MVGDILNAILAEAQAVVATVNGQVIFKTDFLAKKGGMTAVMPLILLDMIPGEETSQYLGGVTRVDYMFAFNSYNYEPDAYGDENNSGYSTGLLDVIDTIRQHFSMGIWLTPGMSTIEQTYGFKFTLSGISQADGIDESGLIVGHRIHMDSIALDISTANWVPGPPLQSVQPGANPPVS